MDHVLILVLRTPFERIGCLPEERLPTTEPVETPSSSKAEQGGERLRAVCNKKLVAQLSSWHEFEVTRLLLMRWVLMCAGARPLPARRHPVPLMPSKEVLRRKCCHARC